MCLVSLWPFHATSKVHGIETIDFTACVSGRDRFIDHDLNYSIIIFRSKVENRNLVA